MNKINIPAANKNVSAIALVDCDSFFCNCERIFRPDLKNKPIGVLSNNDGCFVSRTPELKKIGIPMGAPYFQYKDLCKKNNVNVFSSNFALYTNISDRVMATLSQFSPEMEAYSVDEGFLNLSHVKSSSLGEYAKQIKNTIQKNIGIPVSIGIGANKVQAKIATEVAKKNPQHNGIFDVTIPENLEFALNQVPVEDIWGVGRRTAAELRSIHINTAKDFRDFSNDYHIKKKFTKTGLLIKKELEGCYLLSLNKKFSPKKSIMCSRSFGKPITKIEDLQEAIAHYASNACEKLREQNSVCSSVSIFIRTSRFNESARYNASEPCILMSATDDTRIIVRHAIEALNKIYKSGYEYKKAGVLLSTISNLEDIQFNLFQKTQTTNNLMNSLDKINKKYGPGSLKVAACGVNKKKWNMNRKHHSPRFVSDWNELPIAK